MARDLTLPGAGEAKTREPSPNPLAGLPSVDRLLGERALIALAEVHGRLPVKRCVQAVLALARERIGNGGVAPGESELVAQVALAIARDQSPRLRPVFNLTGTVIHTNLGRALLAPEAIDAVGQAMRDYAALEYDLARGGRGDRDVIVEELLRELTGCEAATIVNNNAAAVLLTLKALAAKREVVISRGELIEIGGAFRLPDIMKAAGCKLVEVGTTNRTHSRDYENAITDRTALVVKAHASNYAVTGFTASVDEAEIAAIAHARGVPFVVDLGSGALIDLVRFGLPAEPMPRDTLAAGADVVTFSGDKLLFGPQAGIILGRRELIAKITKDPLKRALRVSKLTLAALEATLRVIASDHRLPERLPVLGLLMRSRDDIRAACERVRPAMTRWAGEDFEVRIADCASQIGSGSQPVERLASAALVISPRGKAKGRLAEKLEAPLRTLPIPVIGRIHDGALWLDLRCLSEADEARFLANLHAEPTSC